MALFKHPKTTPSEKPATTEIVAAKAVSIKGRVLLRPLVTEKATVTGTYCFKVSSQANKQEIAKEFKAIYGKTPRKVNVLNRIGKTVKRGRVTGKQADVKKAIVYLKKGETVDVFAN